MIVIAADMHKRTHPLAAVIAATGLSLRTLPTGTVGTRHR